MRHPFMLPSVAVIDPMLTLSLPRAVTVDTGLDALTQCIEPYVCCVPNPMIDAISMAGIVAGAGALRRVVDDGSDVDAREQMCLCSYYGGLSLANAKLGAVHGFSGTLGGLLHAPHGAICASLLPHSWTINIAALEGRVAAEDPALAARALERYAQVARAITGNADATVQDGIAWIVDLCEYCGVPGLGSLGLKESDFASVVEKSKQSSSMKGQLRGAERRRAHGDAQTRDVISTRRRPSIAFDHYTRYNLATHASTAALRPRLRALQFSYPRVDGGASTAPPRVVVLLRLVHAQTLRRARPSETVSKPRPRPTPRRYNPRPRSDYSDTPRDRR